MALGRTRDFDGAITEFNEVIRLQPNAPIAHHDLGLALYMKGDKQAALAEVRKASELAPTEARLRDDYEKLQKEISGGSGGINVNRELERIKQRQREPSKPSN